MNGSDIQDQRGFTQMNYHAFWFIERTKYISLEYGYIYWLCKISTLSRVGSINWLLTQICILGMSTQRHNHEHNWWHMCHCLPHDTSLINKILLNTNSLTRLGYYFISTKIFPYYDEDLSLSRRRSFLINSVLSLDGIVMISKDEKIFGLTLEMSA